MVATTSSAAGRLSAAGGHGLRATTSTTEDHRDEAVVAGEVTHSSQVRWTYQQLSLIPNSRRRYIKLPEMLCQT